MQKPEMKTQPPAYDFMELQLYIEHKYGVSLRQYKPLEGGERCDFWHGLVAAIDVKRGTYGTISSQTYFAEEWEQEVLNLFLTEFGDRIRCWFDW